MIEDALDRRSIASKIARSLDDLVEQRMAGLVEEPDITSRVGQRLEDQFNGKVIAGYEIRVISETITSHGPKSLEKRMGADLYLAIEVMRPRIGRTAKGVLIQAKRDDKLAGSDLVGQCRRMNLITKKGSVVWLYTKSGIRVARSIDVLSGKSTEFSNMAFFDRVLKCSIGDKRKIPDGPFGDRANLKSMLQTLGAKAGIGLKLSRR